MPGSMIRIGVLAAGVLAACDLPTALPRVESRFVVPGETTTLGVDELLPSTITSTGGSFRVRLDPQAVGPRTLGQLCGSPCAGLEGERVPKPAFTDTIPVRVPFPAELSSADLVSGRVPVMLYHDFGFDPLQPPGRQSDGSITITLRSGGRTLGGATLTGPFPSGTWRVAFIQLAAGAVSDALEAQLVLVSPAGGQAPEHWVTVRNRAALSGRVAPEPIELAEVRIAVRNRTVAAEGAVLDLSGVDAALAERVRSGAIVVDFDNPFALSGPLTLRLSSASGTLTRTVQLAPGETRQRLEFTGAELRSLLRREVTLSLSGTVDAPGPVAVRPGQAVTIATQLELVVELGPEG